jgi:hypothetical protein
MILLKKVKNQKGILVFFLCQGTGDAFFGYLVEDGIR